MYLVTSTCVAPTRMTWNDFWRSANSEAFLACWVVSTACTGIGKTVQRPGRASIRQRMSPTIVLEAVASYDLWIWHAFFGMPGSHNDINVLDRSPLFAELQNGRTPAETFR